MELLTVDQITETPFIIANTQSSTYQALKEEHIIPVFSKDNHPLIAQFQIIETMMDVLSGFKDLKPLEPQIRVSHPIMGRIPEARTKKAFELLPHETTLYFERMMFLIKIPNIRSLIEGKELSLVIGGVKSYSWDNLGKDQRASQHFKFFIGFQVKVCSNLCISTDGAILEFKTSSIDLLGKQIRLMVEGYSPEQHLSWIESLSNYSLTEGQFAHFLGKCRMYQHHLYKEEIPEILITDSQLSSVTKGYYSDPHFSNNQGNISLWNLYNLLTEANKSSYIDGFLDRGVNAQRISNELIHGLESNQSWFL